VDIQTSSNIVTISGNIKSINDFQDIKKTLDGLSATHKEIVVNILDSISITSSIIGYLNKLVLKDGISLQLKIAAPQLMELIDDLNLTSTFKATKV
jgi:hypothetical protein